VKRPHESVIVQITGIVMVPFIQLFALYVIFHGHYGPGGGFQGGALLGVSFILTRLFLGQEASSKRFPSKLAAVFACTGLLIYFLTGLIPLFNGGNFLDYAHLPIPGMHAAELRYYGIMFVEIGVALGVFGTIVLLYDNLAGENW